MDAINIKKALHKDGSPEKLHKYPLQFTLSLQSKKPNNTSLSVRITVVLRLRSGSKELVVSCGSPMFKSGLRLSFKT